MQRMPALHATNVGLSEIEKMNDTMQRLPVFVWLLLSADSLLYQSCVTLPASARFAIIAASFLTRYI